MDQSTAREEFANQSALIIRELQEMLEKTKQIEAFLMQEINPESSANITDSSLSSPLVLQLVPQISTVDFYRPADETQNSQPPKKRIKLSIS